jgi:hypothetical protein
MLAIALTQAALDPPDISISMAPRRVGTALRFLGNALSSNAPCRSPQLKPAVKITENANGPDDTHAGEIRRKPGGPV